MRPAPPRAFVWLFASLVVLHTARDALAATIHVGPGDDYTKIEAAVAGDTVLVAPGTYKFRVYLTGQGTSAQPIVIRAEDPNNPPVWDLGGQLVEDWPGSYTGGDNGRGCWQVGGGAYYLIDTIVFQNCTTASQNSAGFRYNAADHVTLRNVVSRHNQMGITGDGTNIVVEFSEVDHNGNPQASEETHNLYVYGGSFTLRYSFVHDSLHGQNFHLRCLDCRLESNWIARAQNYEGDIMPTGDGMPAMQKLVLLGNVIVQAPSPENGSQVIAPFNDTGATGLSFEVDLLWNTIIGNGGGATLLQFNNQNLVKTTGVLSNNVVAGLTSIYGSTDASKTTVSGSNNWVVTGAAPTTGLSGTLFGSTPGLDAHDRPMPGSPLIGAADTNAAPAPTTEYYEDEMVTRMYRQRLTAKDIGAFESTTTGPGIGPEGMSASDAGAPSDGGAFDGGPADAGDAGAAPDATAGDGGPGGGQASPPGTTSGCGCRQGDAPQASSSALGLTLAVLLLARRRRRLATRTPAPP
jgi:MYXO-CTERM domain-containing protein